MSLLSSLTDRSRSRRHPYLTLVATLVGCTTIAVLAGCGSDDGPTESGGSAADRTERPPTVVATTDIWADVVVNVACQDLVEVETLIPAGGDPHSFEPSLQDRAILEDAALIVANGLDLEEGLVDTLDAMVDEGVPVFEMAAHVDTIEFDLGGDDHGDEGDDHGDTAEDHGDEGDDHGDTAEDHGDEGDDHGDTAEDHGDEGDAGDHHHDGADPHIWFDPKRVAAALPVLAQELVEQVGLDQAAVESCIADYQVELTTIDTEIVDMVAEVPESRRKLVTGHDSLGYFADRYGFDVIGTVIPGTSSMAATNPAQLEELAEAMELQGIVAIFTDAEGATDDADALAERLDDVVVIPLSTGSLGDPENEDATYVGFLRRNARLIVDGLS